MSGPPSRDTTTITYDGYTYYCHAAGSPPATPPPGSSDSDGDGVPDSTDACPYQYAKTADGEDVRIVVELRSGSNRVCDVTVEVSGVPGHEPYRASCKHPIPFAYLAQMQSPGAVVAVRVDANDPQHIALDLDHEAPADGGAPAGSVSIATPDGNVDVPTHASPVKAGELLARGIPCRAKLLMSTPLGQRNDAGLDVMGLVFTVAAADGTPYQCQIGVGVPADAMPLLYPNSDLPARALEEWLQHPAQPDMVTIDWATAMTEHAGS